MKNTKEIRIERRWVVASNCCIKVKWEATREGSESEKRKRKWADFYVTQCFDSFTSSHFVFLFLLCSLSCVFIAISLLACVSGSGWRDGARREASTGTYHENDEGKYQEEDEDVEVDRIDEEILVEQLESTAKRWY
jgi:hypothetical protein